MRYIREYNEIGKFYLIMEAYKNISNLIQEKTNSLIIDCNLWINDNHFLGIYQTTETNREDINYFRNSNVLNPEKDIKLIFELFTDDSIEYPKDDTTGMWILKLENYITELKKVRKIENKLLKVIDINIDDYLIFLEFNLSEIMNNVEKNVEEFNR